MPYCLEDQLIRSQLNLQLWTSLSSHYEQSNLPYIFIQRPPPPTPLHSHAPRHPRYNILAWKILGTVRKAGVRHAFWKRTSRCISSLPHHVFQGQGCHNGWPGKFENVCGVILQTECVLCVPPRYKPRRTIVNRLCKQLDKYKRGNRR